MPEESRKKAKKTTRRKKDSGAKGEKSLQVRAELVETQSSNAVVVEDNQESPQWGGQNKIEVTPYIIAKAEKMAGIGLSNGQIAAALDMHRDTLRAKCAEHPELASAIMKGRAIGVNNVASKLYAKAVEEDNVAAQMYFLERKGGWTKEKAIKMEEDLGPQQLENNWTIEVVHVKKEEDA